MHAAVNQRVADLRPLFGKADRDLRADQVLERRGQTLDEQRQEHAAGQAQLRFFDPGDIGVVGFHGVL